MFSLKRAAWTTLSLVTLVSLTACGGGGGGGSSTDTPPVAGTQVTSKGSIEKFGSITVNGVEFRTQGATLLLPDDTVTPSRTLQTETQVVDDKLLKLGMVVTVKGTLDDNGTTGVAKEIEFRDTLKAKIDDNGVDLVNNTITVMGQKIAVDDRMKLLIGTLKPGDLVQVSGLPDDKGGLRATFIEKKVLENEGEVEVKGFVKLTGSSNTFTLILTENATTGITITLPAGAALPAAGSFIEVKAASTASGATITATRTHVEDVVINPVTPGVKVSIEGFPATGGKVSSFTLNGQSVVTNAQTVFVGGTAADFSTTKKIQAEGIIANGVLTASKITFKAAPVLANPGASMGEIEKFGSVVVNGVEFKTAGAVLHLPDDKTTPDRILQTETEIQGLLKKGMVVRVKGGIDDNGTGTAQEIEVEDALKGKIEAVDAANKTITVLGQQVRIEDNITRLNDDDTQKTFVAGAFAVDQRVEVNGFFDDNGGLRATRVAKKAEGEFEVKGFVVSVGTGTFGLSLTPGGAATLTVNGALPAGAVVGSIIEVNATAAPASGVLTATLVKLEDRLGDAGEKAEVEGIVMAGGTADSFSIQGQQVITTPTTLFEGGVRADLVPGVKVEAEGSMNAAGAIVAVKVSFRANIKLEANVANVSANSLTILGKTVTINIYTRIDDQPVNGQRFEVRATMDRDGNLVATRIRATSANDRVFLQGPVAAKDAAAGTLTILGVPVSTNASTQFRVSFDEGDVPVAKADFFAKVKTGVTVVKARWATSTLSVPAEEVEVQLGK